MFKRLLFLALFSFPIFISSQNPCYIRSAPGFTAYSRSIISADFTGDGIMDLATAGTSLSLQAGTGNGTFGNPTNYPHGLMAFSYQSDLVSADFNSDGKPDVAISSYTNQVAVLLKTSLGFSSPQIYPIIGGCISICSADFNNDGKPDIATVNNLTAGFSVLINNGTGGFNSAVNYSMAVTPNDITAADFNNDGKKDIAIAHQGGNTVLIALNNGTGQFTSLSSIPTPTNCDVIRSGDFNTDGKFDLAVGMNTGYLSILNGNGTGGFSLTATHGLGCGVSAFEIADMTGDNLPDLVCMDAFDVVNFFANSGSGSFARTSWLSPSAFSGITLNDFTGDGRADLAGTSTSNGQSSVLVNNTTKGFLTQQVFKVLDIGVNNGNYHVSKGDMNNDGYLDIITSNNNLGSFSILYGDGAGLFTTVTYSTNLAPLATVAGDFNGDGKLDVAVVGYTNNLSIYMNAGGSVFNYNGSFAVGANPHRVSTSDMNNDGKLDLVVANYGSNNISVLMGLGNGSFSGQTAYTVGSNANDITISDFNNDGNKDVAVAVWNNTVRVFNGSPSGTLTAASNYIVSSVPGGITSGDFNNDGAPDLAISCAFSYSLGVKLNNGAGSFGATTFYPLGWDDRTVITGDYNGDGNLDLATGGDQGGSLQIYTGSGTGTFAAPVPYLFGQDARIIISGDFNSDNKPDFAASNSHYVAVMLTSLMPTISVAGSSISCAGAALNFTASGAAVYYWSGQASGSGSVATYYPQSNAIYTITGVNSPYCTTNIVKTVSVIPSPTVIISASANSVCSGSSVSLVASGAITYTWSNGSTNAAVILSPTISSNFSVTGTASNSCQDTSFKSITVIPLPVLNVNGSGTLCSGTSATLTVSGANSYTWSNSSNSNSIVVSPSTNTCYTVSGVSLGCTNTASICISVIASPTLVISPASASVCLGTSQLFTASGATSFTWLPNAFTPTLSVLPLNSTSYTLLGESNGCITSAVVSLTVDSSCSDVWPGDTNSDGIVDASDILEIGLAFLNTGPLRPLQGNSYSAHYASVWTGSVSTGKNKCHADCDGNGLVNNSDTVAISANFLLSHPFKPSSQTANSDISLVSQNANMISTGEWNKLDIFLSEPSLPINVYGVAFEIGFDQNLIENNSVYLNYSPSFLKNNNSNIEFNKLLFSNGKICGASVRTDLMTVSGGGKIGEFHFKVKPGLLSGTALNVSIGNSKKVEASGSSAQLTGNSLQLLVNTALSIEENAKSQLIFYPNPGRNSIVVSVPVVSSVSYEILDICGRSLLKDQLAESKTIDTSKLNEGSYFIIFRYNGLESHHKLLIQN